MSIGTWTGTTKLIAAGIVFERGVLFWYDCKNSTVCPSVYCFSAVSISKPLSIKVIRWFLCHLCNHNLRSQTGLFPSHAIIRILQANFRPHLHRCSSLLFKLCPWWHLWSRIVFDGFADMIDWDLINSSIYEAWEEIEFRLLSGSARLTGLKYNLEPDFTALTESETHAWIKGPAQGLCTT